MSAFDAETAAWLAKAQGGAVELSQRLVKRASVHTIGEPIPVYDTPESARFKARRALDSFHADALAGTAGASARIVPEATSGRAAPPKATRAFNPPPRPPRSRMVFEPGEQARLIAEATANMPIKRIAPAHAFGAAPQAVEDLHMLAAGRTEPEGRER